MKKANKGMILAGCTLFSVLVLSACGDVKAKDTGKSSDKVASEYNYIYTTDPTTLDYTFSSRGSNSGVYTNFVDGLMEFDEYGNVVPSLAKDWEISKDHLTYTYHLKEGVKWVDSEGNEKGEVKAQDFITGMKHAVAAKSELLYIVADSIKGLSDYIDGKNPDFNQVGIKVVDDYTISYTLNNPEPYWNSKTSYGILFPINEEFLKEKGENFGQPTPDGILYNGAYVLTNFTGKSVIEYSKNESYWDKEHVYLDTVKLTYSDGSDPDSYYKGFAEGKYTTATVYPNNPAYSEVEKEFNDNIIWKIPQRSTYDITLNLARRNYSHTSKKTTKEKTDSQTALLNKEFRQALQFSFDKASYMAQSVGEKGAKKNLRNTFVPGDFVSIKGQDFSKYTEKELKQISPDVFGNVSLADGQDGTYQVKKGQDLFKKAKEALLKEKVAFPIHLDFPQLETDELSVNAAKSFKKSIEDNLGKENVVIDIQLLNQDAYNTATYMAGKGEATDFDLSAASGWSADYTDPQSFLNTYQSQHGDLLDTVGFDQVIPGQKDASQFAKDKVGMKTYDDLLQKANEITDDLDKRYQAYAKAEAWLLDSSIQIPVKAGGGEPTLTKELPFTRKYGMSGNSTTAYKGVKLQNTPVTTEEYQKALTKWLEEKEASAKKYSELTAEKYTNAK